MNSPFSYKPNDPDAPEAWEEFEEAWEFGSRVVGRYLTRRGLAPEDREDVLQIVRIRIWRRWEQLHFENRTSFIAYLKQTAIRVVLRFENLKNPMVIALLDDAALGISDADPHREAIHALLDFRRIMGLADECFLGPRPDDFESRLACATSILVDQVPLEEAHRAARQQYAPSCPAQPRTFEDWALHPRVIQEVALNQLHACMTGAWKDAQTGELRVGREALASRVTRLGDSGAKRMRLLLSSRAGQPAVQHACSQSTLWKRYAFSLTPYELTKEEFCRILQPPAGVFGYTVTKVAVHGWVSNRRLMSQLVAFAAKHQQGVHEQ